MVSRREQHPRFQPGGFHITSRPFIINRDTTIQYDGVEARILVDLSEYDGYMEDDPWIAPLNRLTVLRSINRWERYEDFFVNPVEPEIPIHFKITYRVQRDDGTMIDRKVEYEFGGDDGIQNPTVADFNEMQADIETVVADLERPGTVVVDFTIYGETRRKMCYRIEKRVIDLTPV